MYVHCTALAIGTAQAAVKLQGAHSAVVAGLQLQARTKMPMLDDVPVQLAAHRKASAQRCVNADYPGQVYGHLQVPGQQRFQVQHSEAIEAQMTAEVLLAKYHLARLCQRGALVSHGCSACCLLAVSCQL